MPAVKVQIDPDGPFVSAIVGVSRPRKDAIEAADGIVPAVQSIRLLIDTGASGTCIDRAILAGLEIEPTDKVQIHSASSGEDPEWRLAFDVSLWIPISMDVPPRLISHGMRVLECSMKRHGFDGVLGRDVLSVCVLTYNGPEKFATLSMEPLKR